MAGLFCPNESHKDFLYAVEKLGSRDKALYLYDLLNREIPTKEQVDTILNGTNPDSITPIKEKDTKESFIERANSRIENGMYKQKDGKLIPITPSFNPEVWWIENHEDLVDFNKGTRNEQLFKFNDALSRVIELNKKYNKEGFTFAKKQVVFPPVTVVKSTNPAPNNKKIYKIEVTKPLIRDLSENTFNTDKEANDAIIESSKLVDNLLDKMENKTPLEIINLVNNEEIDDELKSLLDLFISKLDFNSTLKIDINNTENVRAADYDKGSNIITIYRQGHINRLSSSVNNVGISLVHELLHAFTVRALFNNFTETEKEFTITMTRLYEIAKKQTKYSDLAAYSSVEEFTARVLTQPKIMQEAMRMKLNLWGRIVNGVKKLLGITNVYDHALKTVVEYIQNNDTFVPNNQFGKIARKLEEDVYLNQDNVSHKNIWDTLHMFSLQFDFNEVDHTYTHIKTGQVFNSTTEMMGRLKINSSFLSEDPEKRKKQLEHRARGSNIGTIIHSIAESDLKQIAIDIADSNSYSYDPSVVATIEQTLKQIRMQYPNSSVLSEVLVADIDLLLAGTIDLVIIDKNNQIHLYDFKNKEKGFSSYLAPTTFGGSQTMSDKQRHAVQLSAYGDMFEKMTGLNVASLNVVPLVPTLNSDNVITSIRVDKTHSATGIIEVDYNPTVNQIYQWLKVTQGKSIKDEFEQDKVDPETRKEIEDRLKGMTEDVLNNISTLSDKKNIVLKSIKALMHKKEVLYRTGKKSEIAGQDKLIDKLITEKDVEKQLIEIVKYANTLSLRILNEYNDYKKQGKTLPLNILYAWKDSVSAFNALTNETEGLDNIISKEIGFSGGPEYRTLLQDTTRRVAVIKSLYETEGLDQLVDFLSPFYNRLYAELRLTKIKEYRRKKIKGEIKEGITESQYVDKSIDEQEEDLQKRTKTLLRIELKKASKDVNVLTRWLDNLLDSTDPVTAAMVKAFAYADEDSRIATLENRDEIVSLVRGMEIFYKNQGKVPRSNEEFYDFMLEKKDGKLTGHYATRYTSDMMKEYRNIVAAAREFTPEQRKKFIHVWLDGSEGLPGNMPLAKKEFASAYWSHIERQAKLGFISEESYNKLYNNQFDAINKLNVGEMLEKGYITFEESDILDTWLSENTWDYRMPADKWKNLQWPKLDKIKNDKNDARGIFYNYIVKARREADNMIPFGFRLDSRLPGVIKQTHERIASGQGIASTIKNSFKDELTFRIDDTNRIHEEITDEANNAKYFLPMHFTGRVTKEVTKKNDEGEEYVVREFDADEQSFDLGSIYHKFWGMANDYHVKNDILPQMELAKFMINKRQAIKRNSIGNKIFRKSILKGQGDNPDKEETYINNTNLAQQVNDWFLSCVYGVKEKDEGKIGNVDVGKLLNFINSYTSLNLLGVNFVAGTANVILGETLQRIESFAHEYMNPKDFLYADKFYLRSMKGMIGDIGSRDVTGLGSHIIEEFGVFDDYGESDMDKRTRFSQLMNTNTLYFTSHLGEHYMQSRFLFGMLSNKRAYDINGKDIGHMIDMYELKDNKLVFKKEVDLVKSKWEEWDQKEFKSKVRGILSRLHGEYGSLGKVAVQRMAIGRMAYLFRHFIIPGFRRRWGKEEYIERLGQFVEGNYITTGKFIGATGSKIFGKTEENKEMQFFGRLISNLQSLKLSMFNEEWESLSDHEKANIHRTLYEVGFLVLAIIMANILAGMKPDPDDDDEAAKRYWAFAVYQTYRFQNELLFFSPNLTSSMSILRSPAASMSFVENIIKLSGQIFDPTALYESGPWKGRPKILKTLNDMVPVEKQYYRYMDIFSQIPWMSKSGFGGKNNQKDANTAYTTPTIK